LPEGSTRIHAGLTNIRRLEIVTTHGSSRTSNLLGGRPGRLIAFRTLRLLCHPLCRRRFHPIYSVTTASEADIESWLDRIEARFAGASLHRTIGQRLRRG
jgi:putative NADPH-quinone reductase